MSTPLSLLARQARLLALRDLMDVGGAGMQFYTGDAVPDTPETATTETLLGTVTLATPSGAISSIGATATLALTVPRTNAAIATGSIGWVRFIDGAGAGVMDLQVGKVGVQYTPPRPVLVSDLQVYAGGELQLISCVISE